MAMDYSRVTKMLGAHCPPRMKGSDVVLNEFERGKKTLSTRAGILLLISIHDSTAGKIVGRDFHPYSIPQ